jgi:hypothetical protein
VVAVVRQKICSRCKLPKPRAAFGRDSSKPDGRNIYDQECARALSRESKARQLAGAPRPRGGWRSRPGPPEKPDEEERTVRVPRVTRLLQEIEDKMLADLVSS